MRGSGFPAFSISDLAEQGKVLFLDTCAPRPHLELSAPLASFPRCRLAGRGRSRTICDDHSLPRDSFEKNSHWSFPITTTIKNKNKKRERCNFLHDLGHGMTSMEAVWVGKFLDEFSQLQSKGNGMCAWKSSVFPYTLPSTIRERTTGPRYLFLSFFYSAVWSPLLGTKYCIT